jgi:DNA-binding transcriptional MocR family regulator
MPAGVTWTENEGGFSLLVTLPAGLDAALLLERAAARGVIFTPGNAFFVDGGGERTLRLSFSALPLAQIDEGIKRLAETIRDVQRQPEPAGPVAAPAVLLV